MDTLFERLIADLSGRDAEQLLAECMNPNSRNAKQVPIRYRIIALGFVRKMSLSEVNRRLSQNGCELLYARSLPETTLMYAFSNRLSYEQWRSLMDELHSYDEFSNPQNAFFSGRNISYKELREYCESNSDLENGGLYTQHRTMLMERDLLRAGSSKEEYLRFIRQHSREFSHVREKSRYYFCKYLYYYLKTRISDYFASRKRRSGEQDALSELMIFKGISDIGRKKMSDSEVMDILNNASISCGNIYDAFNQFFFDYVSSDWMDVLLDYYGGDIVNLPVTEKKRFAGSLRHYNPKWRRLNDEQIIMAKWQEMQEREKELDQIYSLSGTNRGFQRNRSGEKSVRNYIKGILDIDRTTLICYLLFFGYDIMVPSNQQIDRNRLDDILMECRMPLLRENDAIDKFVIDYLDAKDPIDFLMDSVTGYALEEKNFFLYHMYNESYSNEEQFRKVLGR